MTHHIQTLPDHLDAVRRYARSIGRDSGHADDLVQECFARALSYPHVWHGVKDRRAYLLTMLHNVHVDDLDRRWREIDAVPIEDVESLLASAPAQFGRLLLRDLARALQMLPESRRRIVLHAALDGMSYQDIAVAMGLPVGTVMSRLSRARRALRHMMSGDSSAGRTGAAGPGPEPRRGVLVHDRDRNRATAATAE